MVEGAFFRLRFTDAPTAVECALGPGGVPGGGPGTFPEAFQKHPEGAEGEKQEIPQVLKASRRSGTGVLAQDQAQVERRHVQQQPLQDVPMSPQMGPPHSARVVEMGEASFQ